MKLKESINFLEKEGIKVEKISDEVYQLTNQQGVVLKRKSEPIINYAEKIKNPKKVTSLVGLAHDVFINEIIFKKEGVYI